MRALCIVLATALLAAGCSGSSSSTRKQTLTVFAASSLTSSFTALGKAFERAHPGVTVTFSFAASSTLAQQIRAAAPADVFASASTKTMSQVASDVDGVKDFATNTAEIAAAPGTTVTGLSDLARPGLKVALCDRSVPCGALADKVLANAHVTVKPVTRGLDVRSTLAYVTNGSADAAIVYVTDVKAAGAKVVGIEVPAAQNSSTTYEIATVTSSRHATLARQFEDYVLSPHGQAALATAGFSAP